MWNKEFLENELEKLKLIKQQPQSRNIEIFLGGTYLTNLMVKFKDKSIVEKDNKNEIIDLVIDTIIKHLENKANEEDLEHK